MTNLDLLQAAIKKTLLEIDFSEREACLYQTSGKSLSAESARKNRGIAEGNLRKLIGHMARLTERAREIIQFEDRNGIQWDTFHWEIPEGDLQEWYEARTYVKEEARNA